MELALEEARSAQAAGEVPVGAVVVTREGVVVGRGFNRPISDQDPTAHAEIVAIRDASRNIGNYRLTGLTLYSTIEPCIMCAGAIIHARVARLVYAAADPKAGAAGSLYSILADSRLNHRVEVHSGVRELECRSLLQAFFRSHRRE